MPKGNQSEQQVKAPTLFPRSRAKRSRPEDYSVIQAAIEADDWNEVDLETLIAVVESKQAREAVLQVRREWDPADCEGAIVRLFCSQKRKSHLLQRLFDWLGEEHLERAIMSRSAFGNTALHCAGGKGDTATVTKLLERLLPEARIGAILACNNNQLTSLHYASANKDTAVLRHLLTVLPSEKLSAVTREARIHDRWNLLQYAVHYGSASSLSMVLAALGRVAHEALSVRKNINNKSYHIIELVSDNEFEEDTELMGANRLRILSCLQTRFPQFFDHYRQKLLEQTILFNRVDIAKAIAITEREMRRVEETRHSQLVDIRHLGSGPGSNSQDSSEDSEHASPTPNS